MEMVQFLRSEKDTFEEFLLKYFFSAARDLISIIHLSPVKLNWWQTK